jgi:hypothetical protein
MNPSGGDSRRDRQPTERFSAHPALQPLGESIYAALPSHHSPGMSVADDGLVSTKAHLGFLRLFFLHRLYFAGGHRLCCGLSL